MTAQSSNSQICFVILGMAELPDIRKEYRKRSLDEESVADNAIDQFDRWWQDALKSGIEEVNAMTLATASADGLPAARILLLKGFDAKGFPLNLCSFNSQIPEFPNSLIP